MLTLKGLLQAEHTSLLLTAVSYLFTTAKAEVKVSGSDSTRMYQFRDFDFN